MTTGHLPGHLEPVAGLSSAGGIARWPTLSASTTFLNWRRTLVWTLAAVALALLCTPFDTYEGWFQFAIRRPRAHRLFIYPSEIPMRIFGLPHFLIALLFTLSSVRMRETRNRLLFAGLAVVAMLLCALFQRAGAQLNPVAIFLFYAYFVVHQFRDDSYFYGAYGELPREATRRNARIVTTLQWIALGVLFAAIWPVYTTLSLRGYDAAAHPLLQSFYPASWSLAMRLGVTFAPAVAVAAIALARIARSFPDGLAGVWRMHRPILVIQLASTGIVLVALIGGSWTVQIVVLMHFVGWYLFALHQIGRRVPAAPRSIWQSMRTTRAGFMTLHLGLAALVAMLMVIDVYGFGRTTWLNAVVGSQSFYYWTIAHVTLSFLPR